MREYASKNKQPYWRRVDADLPDCPPGFADWFSQCVTRKNITLSSRARERALLVGTMYLLVCGEESYALDAALLQASGAACLVLGCGFLTYVKVLPAQMLDGRAESSL